ncbi:MAG: hypothetical protein R2877_01990 [Bdellovibrionota bacterium]
MNKQGKSTYKGNKRDQFTIVLEDIRSKFELLADGILGLREKADRTDQKLDQMDQKFSRLELKMDLGFLELKHEIDGVKSEMDRGFLDLKNGSKTVHNQLENHENRILSLENS